MVRSLHVPMDDEVFEHLRDDLKPPDYDWEEFLIEAGEVYKEQADSSLYGEEREPLESAIDRQ